MKKAYLCIRLITNSGSDKHYTVLSLCLPQLLDQEAPELASANKEECERGKGPLIL